MAVLEFKNNKADYPLDLVTDVINRTKGHSSIAKMVGSEPLSFTGKSYMTFALDDEMNIVAESGKKTQGNASIAFKTMVPVKVEYGVRMSDEFLYVNNEKQIDILRQFNEGFAVKLARALDIMAMHGLNPRTKEASEIIGTNHIDSGTLKVETTAGEEDKDIDKAIALFDDYEDVDVSGMLLSKAYRTSLSQLTYDGGHQKFPELGWGAEAASLRGLPIDVNSTVSFGDDQEDLAILGDFRKYFKYGYAQDMTIELIQYGDPDNTSVDLKGSNQVFLRAEAYLGWAILDPNAFARIVKKK